MPYFKDPAGGLHFLDDTKFSNLLPAGCIAITDIEANVIQNPPMTLAQAQAEKLSSLVQSRNAASTSSVTVHGSTFLADPNTQTDFKRLVDRMRRGKPTTLAALLDSSGNPVTPVTQALMDAIEDAIAANTEAAWNHYGALVQQVKAATTVAQVQAIVW